MTILEISTNIMALNTIVLPNNTAITKVTIVAKPNDGIDLFQRIIPGMVANKHNSQPTSGNIYVTKATTINASVPIIVALGSIFENNFATPILNLTISTILTRVAY